MFNRLSTALSKIFVPSLGTGSSFIDGGSIKDRRKTITNGTSNVKAFINLLLKIEDVRIHRLSEYVTRRRVKTLHSWYMSGGKFVQEDVVELTMTLRDELVRLDKILLTIDDTDPLLAERIKFYAVIKSDIRDVINTMLISEIK